MKAAVRRSLEIAALRQCSLVTSELSIAECLYGAFKLNDDVLASGYRAYFSDRGLISLVPITVDVLEQAAERGAFLKLKTLDAIHVVSAILSGCDAILSNDRALRAPGAIDIVPLT